MSWKTRNEKPRAWTSTEGIRACMRHGFLTGDYFYYDTRYMAMHMQRGDEIHIVGKVPPWLESAAHIQPLIKFVIHPDILPTEGCSVCLERGHKERSGI